MMPELTGPLSIPCNNVHLFNYCTSFLASNPHLLCEKIVAVPEVNGQQSPLSVVLDPLPVIGSHLSRSGSNNPAINFAVKL